MEQQDINRLLKRIETIAVQFVPNDEYLKAFENVKQDEGEKVDAYLGKALGRGNRTQQDRAEEPVCPRLSKAEIKIKHPHHRMPTMLQRGGRQTQEGVDNQENLHPKHEDQEHEEPAPIQTLSRILSTGGNGEIRHAQLQHRIPPGSSKSGGNDPHKGQKQPG